MKLKIFVSHPCGNVRSSDYYLHLQIREKAWARPINLREKDIQIAYKS